MAWFQNGQGNNREVNDPQTQREIGDKYCDGNGVTQDYAEACKWYRLAADQGYAGAQNVLGFMYDSGYGVTQDYDEAIKWYRLAANQGFPNAQYNIGIMYANGLGLQQDYAEAVKWYRLAADQGYSDAQFNLGLMYRNGYGVTQDYSEAIKWYRLAADQGNCVGQYNLALMYEYGEGVEVNRQKALEWYKEAADQGDADAQRCVGVFYLSGLYSHVDIEEALKWFQKSADQGNVEAKRCLDHVLKTQAELEVIRNKIEPKYFRVAQLLRQVSKISTSPQEQEMWGWFKKGERPSKKGANKFFLTCILDYQMKVELVWSNTEKFVEQTLGDPEDLWEFICGHTLDDWKQKKKEYKLHRFESGHIRVWKIGRDLIQHYGGDARAVWEGHEPAAILERLYQLGDGKYGVGEIIANMIVGALIDTEQIKGVGDVKADTHVRKILGRVFRGYNFGTDEARECTEFARKIYPPNPWLIDNPLFLLGQEICREKNPDCPNCYLRQECLYREKKSLR